MNNYQLQQEKVKRVQATLDNIDERKLDWAVAKPDCTPYATKYSGLCGHWRGWIIGGRKFYEDSPKGDKEFVREVKSHDKRINTEDITYLLKDMRSTSIGRFFLFPDQYSTKKPQ